jgi:uracil-DNA glycosylase
MGLAPLWRLRSRASQHAILPCAARLHSEPDPTPVVAPQQAGTRAVDHGRENVPEVGELRDAGAPVQPAVGSPAPDLRERASRIAGMDWDALEADIRACEACALCRQRKQAVPGTGDRQADWMFVGEGPGAEEDRRGEPFVGPAGKLLDAMLAAIGLQRDNNVYIANAVKCRPPHNRTPEADEIAACHPYLERQIQLVRPRLLIALGRPAAQALLGTEIKINAARGKIFDRGGIPVVVTYHPAYLLRNPADKAKAWEDLCFARAIAAGEVSL